MTNSTKNTNTKENNNIVKNIDADSLTDASQQQLEETKTLNNSDHVDVKQQTTNQVPISAFGIVSIVIGSIALLTSVIPIVNNGTPFISLVGLAFWIPAFVQIKKGKKRSKGIVIAAIILNIIAVVITISMQAACSAALKGGNDVASVNTTTSQTQTETKSNKDNSNLPMGSTISLKNGLGVTVNSVESGFTNYNGEQLVKVTVTYNNTGKDEKSFNTFDWKAEDPQGAQTSTTFYSKGDSSQNLDSGKLTAGGTKTGVIYFKAPASKIIYSSSILSDSSAKWVVG